jgi:hypothetical protein
VKREKTATPSGIMLVRRPVIVLTASPFHAC